MRLPQWRHSRWRTIRPVISGYLRLFEEAELERRHGTAYLRYKSATPFIIPALFRPRPR